MAAPFPFADESLHLVSDDGLCRRHMFAALSQGLIADALQIINVEEANTIAVVDARIEVAGHGNIQYPLAAAGSLRQNAFEALLRHDRLGRSSRAKDNVGVDQRVIEAIPWQALAAAAARHRFRFVGAAIGY